MVLIWAFRRQYAELPFAEVGFARAAFAKAHPDGKGWSRGDILEASSLAAQICNIAIAASSSLHNFNVVASCAFIFFVMLPPCYGMHMVLPSIEYRMKKTVDSLSTTRTPSNASSTFEIEGHEDAEVQTPNPLSQTAGPRDGRRTTESTDI